MVGIEKLSWFSVIIRYIWICQTKKVKRMRYFIPLFVYVVLLNLLYIISKYYRRTNPKYSAIDDILLFGGIPVTFGYFLFVMFNPKNDLRLVSEVIDEYRTRLLVLMVWMVISAIIFVWRNREKTNKLPWRENILFSFFSIKKQNADITFCHLV